MVDERCLGGPGTLSRQGGLGHGPGEVVAELPAPKEPGLQRVLWDLRTEPEDREAEAEAPRRRRRGPLVAEETYPVTLELRRDGVSRVLAGPLNLQVVSLGRMRYERVEGGG